MTNTYYGAKPRARQYAARDGRHYWNGWTRNYQWHRDGYCIHAFCEEDKTGRALCGVRLNEGGGMSFPLEGVPSCLRCHKTMEKRGLINPT